MEKLLSRLDAFTYYMVHKFIKARVKQYGGDALDDSTNWGNWSWFDLVAHLEREVEEFREEDKKRETTPQSKEALKNELADIANLAFCLWSKLEYNDF